MDTTSVFLIILLISASALCIALIVYIARITKSINKIEKKISDLTTDLNPLINSARDLSDKLATLTDEINSQIYISKEVVNNVKDSVDKIISFEENIRRGLEEPVMGLLKNLSAIFNGVNSFWSTYKNQH
ncbi:MAG: DUF948 domain-containing protein [Ignavibacteriales bacterium]|nr:DUF948 domain-containing protein [Ignavibacteriales bacterium]MBK7380356.1 DUF948 domain-containing protein [Ignavibacteriales bacterium]